MKTALDVLTERGFIEQLTHEPEIKELFEKEKITFYIGFDPTADSLTVGHFLTVMAMSHLQKAGHRPIALVGGGTGMVGDPTDRTDLRRLMANDEIQNNVNNFKSQLSKFIDFADDKAILINNAEWLLDLKYVDFIRTYGVHFSVNRMLTADAYKTRFEKGLTFFEFNYMLMQAYDFLELNRRFDCVMQLGGSDQWSNILAGVELIRRVENKNAYGMTFKLLTKSDGQKMGKSMAGAIWLDPNKTSPFEFFQYWRNIDDSDVKKCLSLLTYLPMEEIEELGKLEGSEINKAKEILAYEVTKIVHSEEEAQKALDAAKSLFSGAKNSESIPNFELSAEEFGESLNILELLQKVNLTPSRSEGRRLVEQGGIKVNEEKVESIERSISISDFKDNEILIQKGKKVFLKVVLV